MLNRRDFLAASATAALSHTLARADADADCSALWTTELQPGCDADACQQPAGEPNPITMADFGCGLPFSAKPPWIDFQLPGGTPIRRRLWSEIDPQKDRAYLDDLKKAYCLFRQLDLTRDKRGLRHQMWLHEFYCNQWPIGDIHRTWAFLPWHRGFLYFHEKILGSLIGKSDFRLPVWDWDPDGRWYPQFYRDLGLPNFLKGAWGRNPTDVSRGKWMNRCVMQAWLFGATFSDFMGFPPCQSDPCAVSSPCPAVSGWAARAAHILGHTVVGGAMSIIPSSAADPLFYAHHANVDRYWYWWKHNNQNRVTVPREFSDQCFFFYDENKQLVRVRAGQLLDEAGLGYCYDLPPTPWCPLESVDLMTNSAEKLAALTVGALLAAPALTLDLLQLPFKMVSGKLNISLTALLQNDCLKSLPARVQGVVVSGHPLPGKYYLVQVKGHLSGQYTLGGFGIFPSSHQHVGDQGRQVAVAACVDPNLWKKLQTWKGDRYLSYGLPPDSVCNTKGICSDQVGQTGTIEITGFDLLVPDGWLHSGTQWLKDHHIHIV